MLSVTVFPVRCPLLLAFALLLWHGVASSQASSPTSPDASMLLQNLSGPFVTSDFARKLGALIMHEKYPGTTFDPEATDVLDKGDVWWVVFTVKEWPKEMQGLKPVLPGHLTLWIRKADASVLAIH